MPTIPEFHDTNNRDYDESVYGREESKRPADAEIITWKYCEKCKDITLHSFRDRIGECMKCRESV